MFPCEFVVKDGEPKYVTVVERGMMMELIWSRMFQEYGGTFIGGRLKIVTNEPVL